MNKGTEGIKKQLFGRIKTTFWEFKNDFLGVFFNNKNTNFKYGC